MINKSESNLHQLGVLDKKKRCYRNSIIMYKVKRNCGFAFYVIASVTVTRPSLQILLPQTTTKNGLPQSHFLEKSMCLLL